MIALIRLAVFAGIGLAVVYLSLWIYARSVRREELEKAWARDHPDGGDPDAREAYIETGVQDHETRLRRRLILFVLVLPLAAMAAIIYLTNYR